MATESEILDDKRPISSITQGFGEDDMEFFSAPKHLIEIYEDMGPMGWIPHVRVSLADGQVCHRSPAYHWDIHYKTEKV